MTTQPAAERAEDRRDLKRQVKELEGQDDREILFRETSPTRRLVSVYSTIDGEEIRVPSYMLDIVLDKRDGQGKYLFTARKETAPEYKPGILPCFFHADAKERPILEALGIADPPCPAGALRNNFARRIHAQNRHKRRWEAYREHLDEIKEEEARGREQQQLDAMLALAGQSRASEPAPAEVTRRRWTPPLGGKREE